MKPFRDLLIRRKLTLIPSEAVDDFLKRNHRSATPSPPRLSLMSVTARLGAELGPHATTLTALPALVALLGTSKKISPTAT